MASDLIFTQEEISVDGSLGYPKAFAKLCRDRSYSTFNHGPPVTFMPYAMPQQEAQKLEKLFPIINIRARETSKPKIFLLWDQLNHLGNAGFDPKVFRVDPYGNVLYFHADAASPLAWKADHWFPCSRGGLTVASNLRIIQLQVHKKKKHQLEFLMPWWDFQVGVSINQFLSIYASANSDFRCRGFSWLFANGESEELYTSQTVSSHAFPRLFDESSQKIGLAPAAVVLCHPESLFDRSLDMNKNPRLSTPIIGSSAAGNVKPGSNENSELSLASNPYQAIVIGRDSLRQKDKATEMQAEKQKLDSEVKELNQKAVDGKISIENLELELKERRRQAEKGRKLVEDQTAHRRALEKMIRDARHQRVVYKEQARLNEAAHSSLKATLDAQRALLYSSERELHQTFKQMDEVEKQIAPSLLEDEPSSSTAHKQLEKFLEEERRASAAEKNERINIVIEDAEKEIAREDAELDNITLFPSHDDEPEEEDEDTDEIIRNMDVVYPQKEARKSFLGTRIIRPKDKKAGHQIKDKELGRSESARTFRRILSSPLLILNGLKKKVDCMSKKPLVMDDDEDRSYRRQKSSILKSTIIKTIKRAVKM